jgi:glycosyltransferase involved in cell wall biosynthesis
MTSIVITYHCEPREFLLDCINQVKATSEGNYEIIVVDDFSNEPLAPIEGVKIIRNPVNVGVGKSFDAGVREAQGENLILMACDIRLINNGWMKNLVAEIEKNPKSLICTKCVGLNQNINPETGQMDNMNFEKRRGVQTGFGATILMFHDKKSNPVKSETFRGIIEAQWWPQRKEDVYEVPCILGACYGVKKDWYNYIDGWRLHRQWGTLEPMISLKSWLFGGNCLCAKYIETAHIFKEVGSPLNVAHGIKQDAVIFNKLLVATLLLPDYKRYIDFLGDNSIVRRSKAMIEANIDEILEKRQEYAKKTVMPLRVFADKFGIDLRKEPEAYEYE